MPTIKESICCKEIGQVVLKMDKYAGYDESKALDCITEHHGFRNVCLDIDVLETAYYQYRQQYGDGGRHDATENQRNRHVGYRQMARWIWGFLGREVRVPLPSCAVVQIREAFPSMEYRGFREI
ncbi:uncharacterized protein [Diadema antillarum]|uniref:uncharacterized protein n=1 Tax=Diadema antillarum TaxID=105358 RepID=UPI003A8AF924